MKEEGYQGLEGAKGYMEQKGGVEIREKREMRVGKEKWGMKGDKG